MLNKVGKMKKLSLVLICVFMFTMGLAGCGGGDSDKDKPAAKEEFVIGCVGAMTGPSAQLGNNLRVGVDIAVADINAAGGINGMKVRAVFRDDEADPTKCLSLTRELVTKEKVDAFIGPVNTTCCKAIQDYLNQNKIIHMNGGCTGGALIDPQQWPYSFRVHVKDPDQATMMVQRAVAEGYKRIAMVHDTTALGTMAKDGMEAALKEAGLKPVCDATYNVNDVDMLPIAQKLKAANPDICLFFTLGVDGARIVKAMQKIDFLPPKVVVHGYTAITMPVFKDLAGDASKGVLGNAPINTTWADNDKGKANVLEFAEKVKGKGDIIFGTAVSFYQCTELLKVAAEKAQSTDPDKMKEALEGLKDYDGIYCLTTYGPDDHEAGSPGMMTAVDINQLNEYGMCKRVD